MRTAHLCGLLPLLLLPLLLFLGGGLSPRRPSRSWDGVLRLGSGWRTGAQTFFFFLFFVLLGVAAGWLWCGVVVE